MAASQITSSGRSLMYRRTSVGPGMEPWGTPALARYSHEDFPSRTSWSCLLLRKEEKAKYLKGNSIGLKFVKKTSMPNSVESYGYIKCYSLISPRLVKSPSNSIRYNHQKISSWSRRPKTILGIRKKATSLSRWSAILLFTSFSKTLLTMEGRITGQ